MVVPLTFPIRSTITGEETTQLLIKEGTAVYLGMSAANRSTAIWGPDAAEFKPERWLNRSQSENKLPGAYSGMYVVFWFSDFALKPCLLACQNVVLERC